MVELTREQWQAISGTENPALTEPESRTEYVLVRKDMFERWQRVFGEQPDTALLVNE